MKKEAVVREGYTSLLDNILKQIDTLDGYTPWEPIEPNWWLEMMELRKIVQRFSDGHKND